MKEDSGFCISSKDVLEEVRAGRAAHETDVDDKRHPCNKNVDTYHP